ncbi:MAG: bifunctional phosphoribosylaminoimidazolecarboxamide formyltransferase/IMP cyclohydrolase [Deltaproteobacteria bacterium]|nr:bifunctional phosphoribosylaminoimidazolecarboxamide formyltransferase/IMP cyclohydrolase [Deltaproteobacteria bacterium]
MAKITRALVSVSDKTGLVDFVKRLHELGVEILSTGGTSKLLADAGVPVVAVSDYTGSPEILDGRVKTLHPKIHGGLLGRRDDPKHREQMSANKIQPIDMVVVNLYPFEATVAKADCTFEDAIENIDIGGPSMVRSAAKNHHDVTVVVDPADYTAILDEMGRSGGCISVATNTRLARKAFQTTARYDGAIADHLGGLDDQHHKLAFGETVHIALHKAQDLRYGENPHQQGALYGEFFRAVQQLHGKELSYNNIVDINAALYLMLEFIDDPQHCVAILKHNTPCGAGLGKSGLEAYRRAFATDPDSPFGGILIANKRWDLDLAREVDEIFTEVLIAPEFAPEALEFLQKKKNRRLMTWNPAAMRAGGREVRGVFGGLLVQDGDRAMEDPRAAKVVTKRQPTSVELAGLAFGLKVVKHVKSNAIVFCNDQGTLAVGGGATSRVDPVHAARAKAARVGIDLKGSVLASDAFFPFPDGVEEAAKAGITAVVQPGGSVRDDDVIAAADQLNLAMVFTGVRHFRH